MRIKLLLAMGMLVLLAACISTSSEPEIVSTRVIVAPTPAAAPASFDLSSGGALYAQNCAPCHGETGLGDGPSASGFDCPMPQFANRSPDETLVDWFAIVANGKRNSETCIMPPWSRRLNTQQMWDAAAYAYHLVYGVDAATQGQAALESRRTDSSLADFLQQSQWQAENSDSALLNLISTNQLPGYDFSTAIDPAQQPVILAALRRFVVQGEVAIAAVGTPAPNQTAEPGEASTDATPIPNQTAEPDATEAVAAPFDPAAVPGETLTITGTVTSGSAGGSVPADLVLTLRGVALDENGQPMDIYQGESGLDAENRFRFEGVPANPAALALLSAAFEGVRQFSEEIFLGAGENGVLEVAFTLYNTTPDTDTISIAYSEAFIDAVTAENASLIYQSYDFLNNGDRIVVPGDDARGLRIDLPPGAVAPGIFTLRRTSAGTTELAPADDRFEVVREGENFVIYGTEEVLPGPQQRYVVRYNFPYNGAMALQQAFAYPVAQFNVYLSEARGLELVSDAMTPTSSTSFNGAGYVGFTPSAGALLPGESISFRVQDGANTAQPEAEDTTRDDSGGFFQENSALILGIGVLLIIGGGMFLLYDLQKTRLLAHAGTTAKASAPADDRNALAAQIAALDERYESGDLDEDAYQQQRTVLKERLRRLMS